MVAIRKVVVNWSERNAADLRVARVVVIGWRTLEWRRNTVPGELLVRVMSEKIVVRKIIAD
jgi:hypothetical protein